MRRIGIRVGAWQVDRVILDDHEQHATRAIVVGLASLPVADLDAVVDRLGGDVVDEHRFGLVVSLGRIDLDDPVHALGRGLECEEAPPGDTLEDDRVVGDAGRDLLAGAAVGVPGVLVATGKGEAEFERLTLERQAPSSFESDVLAAARAIVSRQGR